MWSALMQFIYGVKAGRPTPYLSWSRVDDTHAGSRGVVDPLPFLAVGMPDVVQVLLLELVFGHAAFGKLCSPESYGRVKR